MSKGSLSVGSVSGSVSTVAPTPSTAGTLEQVLASLAPARRRLVLGLAAVVALGALLGAVLVLGPGGGDAGTGAAPVAQDEPGPVLLVPGYGGATDALDALAAGLRADGRDAQVLPLPGDGTGDLAEQAELLDDAVGTALGRTGASSVDVVGYSAGGVVVRLWAAELGGAEQARRIVTLGSPHHGAEIAGLAAGLLPDACPLACQQLSPDSDLLAGLNDGDETPDGPGWVSIWTTADQLVTPPESARLDGAVNVVVQDVCPASTVDHGNLPRDRLVAALVTGQLGTAPVAAPGAQDCDGLAAG